MLDRWGHNCGARIRRMPKGAAACRHRAGAKSIGERAGDLRAQRREMRIERRNEMRARGASSFVIRNTWSLHVHVTLYC